MKIKLWIIYKSGIGFSRIIAEMILDRLEDYIDIDVGNAKQIDPAFIVEEKFDSLIIGDVLSKEIPSSEIQNWLFKYREISNSNNLIVKTVSGFYIAPSDIKVEPFWIESLQENINAEMIYPPILNLKLNREEIALEDGALEIVKAYSNDFIEFFIKK
jgi:flavodoxin